MLWLPWMREVLVQCEEREKGEKDQSVLDFPPLLGYDACEKACGDAKYIWLSFDAK